MGPVEAKASLVMSDGTLMCPSCDKTSNFKSDLTKHMRVHLGTTKTCFRCENIFQTAIERRTHEKKHACEAVLKDPLNTFELNDLNRCQEQIKKFNKTTLFGKSF